jgi:TRAP-type C4-dicarboxylate transport system substrate-binding protein
MGADPVARSVLARTRGAGTVSTYSIMTITHSKLTTALTAAVLTSALAACSSSASEGEEPSGARSATYSGDAVTLTIGTDDSPGVPSADQIQHFAKQVAQMSDGKITIEPRWHAEGDDHPTDWDQAVAAMVQDGKLDLALGPTWAWDELEVTTFQPLQVPFLVDSDDLVAGIVEDEDLSGKLMAGLKDAGVVGLTMWPEGLRHPFGFTEPLISAEHYDGQVIRSAKSQAITWLFEVLGATTSAKEPNAETMAGMQGEYVLNPSGTATSNVTFFPKVNLLYANAKSYAALDEDAISVLTEAAAKTQAWAIENTDDLDAAATFCAEGGAIVAADESDVAALQKASRPAADRIAQASGNQEIIDAIAELKNSTKTPVAATPCTDEQLERHKPGKAEAAVNGTYRYTLTPADFAAGGRDENAAEHNAGVQTFVLQDGTVHYRLDPSEHEFNKDPAGPDETDGTYQVDGNILTFFFPAFNEVDRMTFEAHDDGDLTMRPFDFPGEDVEFLMTAKVWDKIE